MEAEVNIGAASDGKVGARLHIMELVSAVTGRWGTQGTHTGACHARHNTDTALEPALSAGG